MADVSKRPEDGWAEPLWDKQRGESAKAFEAFGIYRDMGPDRSQVAVGEVLTKSRALQARWSIQWGWVERAEAWDEFADRNARERDQAERLEMRRKMVDRHARGGMKLYGAAEYALGRYDVNDPEHGEEAKRLIAAMTPVEIARLMKFGSEIERQARGETTDRVHSREAQAFADTIIDLCLAHLPMESHEAFLSDVEAKLGGQTA